MPAADEGGTRGPASTKKSLAETAYERIRDEIVTLELEPGAPISEEALSAELSMGKTPVREAIKRLSLEDLVDVYPQRGTFVSEIQMTDLAEISEVRVELEGYAAALAAERFRGADEAELDRLERRLESSASAPAEELIQLDAAVHRFIYRTARNGYLRATLDKYLNLSARMWHLALSRLPEFPANVADVGEVLAAIRAGDRAAAREAMAAHVAEFEQGMRTAL